MMKRILISLSLLNLTLGSLYALPRGVEFKIAFHNKELYYTDRPIYLRASIVNNSQELISFRIANKKVFNLALKVASLENVPVQPSEDFIREKNDKQPVYFRDVSLNQGEEFSFVCSVNEFVNIDSPGAYIVQGEFYPQLKEMVEGADKLLSNTLILFVRPDLASCLERTEVSLQEGVEQLLSKQEMSPDEVVTYTLKARQRDEPGKFFLYLDVDCLILADPSYSISYRTSEANRLKIINDYRELLWSGGAGDFSRKALSFEIINTSYTPQTSKVLARLAFDEGDFISYKDYTFYLKKKDQYWSIYNYSVKNVSIKVKAER